METQTAYSSESIKKKLTRQSKGFRILDGAEYEEENTRFSEYVTTRGSQLDKRARESVELFHNNIEDTNSQYTKKQVAELKAIGAPIVSMNFIMPIISQAKAMVVHDRPTGRVVPETDADKPKAKLLEKLCGGIYRQSYGSSIISTMAKEVFCVGLSGIAVEPSNFYSQGLLRLQYSHVSWEHIFVDPNARDSGTGYQDAEAIYIAKLISKRKCRNLYGVVPDDPGNELVVPRSYHYEDQNNHQVLIRDCYEKTYGIYLICILPNTDGTGQKVSRVVVPDEEAIDRLAEKGILMQDYKEGIFMRKRTILGPRLLVSDVMIPLTVYPVPLFTSDDFTSPYPHSWVEYLREPQKMANRSFQQMLVNAALSSNVRFIGPKGAFVDKSRWNKYAATAGSILEYEADPGLPDGGRPKQIEIQPLSQAFYQITNDLKAYMEFLTGVFPSMQGDASQSPETFSTVNALQSHGSFRLKELRRRFEIPTSILYKATIEYLQFYAPRDEIIRFLDDEDEFTEINLDQILDDTKLVSYDVQVASKSSFPTDRMMFVQILQTVISQVSDANYQKLVFEKILKHLDYPVTDDLLKDFDTLKQLASEGQQLAQKNQYLEDLVQELAREVRITREQASVVKHEAELGKIRTDLQAKADVALGAMEAEKAATAQQPSSRIQEL